MSKAHFDQPESNKGELYEIVSLSLSERGTFFLQPSKMLESVSFSWVKRESTLSRLISVAWKPRFSVALGEHCVSPTSWRKMHLLMLVVSVWIGLFLSGSFSRKSALLKTRQTWLRIVYNNYGMDIHGADAELPTYLAQTVAALITPIQSLLMLMLLKLWISKTGLQVGIQTQIEGSCSAQPAPKNNNSG